MPADSVLVIDAGTSALRALLVGADGALTPLAAEPYHTSVPDDAAPFGREFAPAKLEAALRRLVGRAADVRARTAAVAFTGQREGIAFLDARGQALFASPNIDARAAAEGMAIDAERGGEVYTTTGHLPSLMQVPAKLAWLRVHRPETAARVALVLPLADWLGSLLTGRPATTRSLAAENGLLDVTACEPPLALLAALGFEASLLPPVIADGAVAGGAAWPELAGMPVVLAGADTQCALLGMGALRPGDAGVPAGWSAPVQMVTEAPLLDAQRRTWTGVHVVSGAWILESNAGETGRAWEWLRGLLGLSQGDAYALAAGAATGSEDVMWVIGPRVMRAAQMNAGIGALTFPLPLAMTAAGRGEALRALLESTAYAVRGNLEQVEEVAGVRVERLRLGGGMSRSALFAQTVADVIDRPVDVAASAETSAVGAAMLAASAAGLHPSLDAAVAAMGRIARTVAPEPAASAVYEDCYARWCALSDGLARLAAEAG